MHNNLLSSLHLIVSPLLVCNLNSIVVSLCRRQSPAAAIVVTVVVRVLQPQTTFSGGTKANWVSPESSRLLEQDDSRIVLMLQRRNEREMEKVCRLST